MKQLIHRTRVLLIQIGKALPFLLCFFVLISYTESLFSLLTEDYVVYDDEVILRKPISWFIGNYFEYNMQTLIILIITSLAVNTCLTNKIACLYLCINLYEKEWFSTHDYENDVYVYVMLINMAVSLIIVYKGFKRIKFC